MEVDATFAPLVGRMTSAGVPVVAHIGSRPQQVRQSGVFRSAGRTSKEADQIVELAQVMVDRGAPMLLIEAVPAEVSQRIVDLGLECDGQPVPIIGCGAGPACHGHVVVLHDLLGLTDWHPKFANPNACIGKNIQESSRQWIDLIRSGRYLTEDHPYKMEQ